MKPMLFDVLHTLKSKLSMGVVLFIILISLAGASTFSVNTVRPSQGPPNIYEVYYVSNSTFHVVNYVYNSYGQPFPNVPVSLHLSPFYANGTTNQEGWGNLSTGILNMSRTYNGTERLVIQGTTYNLSITLNSLAITDLGGVSPWGVAWSSYDPLIGIFHVDTVYSQRDPYLRDILLFYIGDHGQPSGKVNVSITRSTTAGTSAPIQIGSASDFYLHRFIPDPSYLEPGAYYQFTETAINATAANSDQFIPYQPAVVGYLLEIANPRQQIGETAATSIEDFFPAVIGLIALLLVYTNLTRISNSGIEQSIISKPLSRRGLVTSRFIATSVVLVGVAIATPVTMDIYAVLTIGASMTEAYLLVLILGLSLTAVALCSLFFMLSSFIKSDPVFLGVGIGVVLVTSILWNPIVWALAMGITGDALGTYNVQSFIMFSNYLTPYVGVLNSYYMLGGSLSESISTPYDPTVYRMLIGVIVWIGITALLWLYGFSRAD
ncbi:ABC-type transport system involved in multi-copper enzyme maturation, permease component [Thermoplasmatales archaeon]|nr:ABC-type transport system involved in multi-copper enzyme maturation, permease component [Thermoplasmatales archaeon]